MNSNEKLCAIKRCKKTAMDKQFFCAEHMVVHIGDYKGGWHENCPKECPRSSLYRLAPEKAKEHKCEICGCKWYADIEVCPNATMDELIRALPSQTEKEAEARGAEKMREKVEKILREEKVDEYILRALKEIG
ncbi:MAG: hypothetical protein KGI72_06050 [Patescibacteria group bacterium]|nr:hypothetical protein [Patescibacteria group bacterium]MDE2233368.1 hypothetical protein [Patescibacteria group bacterium]